MTTTHIVILCILSCIFGYMLELLIAGIRSEKKNKKLKYGIGSGFESKGKFKGWVVEIHTTANPDRYFPKHKETGRYLFWWNTTQTYTLEKNIDGAVHEYSSHEAAHHILAYLDHQEKPPEEIPFD